MLYPIIPIDKFLKNRCLSTSSCPTYNHLLGPEIQIIYLSVFVLLSRPAHASPRTHHYMVLWLTLWKGAFSTFLALTFTNTINGIQG